MKFVAVTATLVVFGLIFASGLPRCSTLVERKEVGEMSEGEWDVIRAGVTKMHRLGWFIWFSFIHTRFYGKLHTVPIFLPWHRRFIREFEALGQFYTEGFFIPYWDSALDSEDPLANKIFGPQYLGGNGGPDGCVKDGLQKDFRSYFPKTGCLTRRFNGGDRILSWISVESVASTLASAETFNDFRLGIEYGIHASVHNGIGGDMSTANSPNDFIFFLHHSYIDRLWDVWQRMKPENMFSYNDALGKKIDTNQTMELYAQPIKDVLEVGYGSMCYTYGNQNSKDNGKKTLTRRNDSSKISIKTMRKFFPLLANNSGTETPEKRSTEPTPNKDILPMSKNGETGSLEDFMFSHITKHSYADKKTRRNRGGLMPIPARLPDRFLEMHRYNKTEYEVFYNRQVELINTLNREGYKTPF
ncbi:hypothetical protein BB559_000846 [Furculomyces boomerangus]|uniref:Tyrosinase copper-binding domain-containing protein n=1 Tax=Furculomyces boomerangus TaxID=61424 RepID=A0A2T9Z3X5_9FUNG|nr:hypothetical protein BB559_000846 [Furculomyces boomerangus]